MKRQPVNSWMIKDDRGQALTEFAIVMPVVLLFFLAMLQYFSIVQAGQLGNYAAFVAARSYAVHGNVDSATVATNMAIKAAAIALAPIARFVPGELFGVGGGISTLVNDAAFNLPAPFQNAADLVEGYACAQWRLNNSSFGGGGSVSIGTSGSGLTQQVDVTIQYPQPMFIPGLAGLWNYVVGPSYGVGGDSFLVSMAPLAAGLKGVAGAQTTGINDYASISNELASFGIAAPPIPSQVQSMLEPYVNIQSKCSLGYSRWGGQPDYQPRLHATSDNTDNSGAITDPTLVNATQNLQQGAQDAQNVQSAANTASNACFNLCTADTNLSNAHSRDDPIINNPQSTPAEVSDAKADLQSYITAQNTAESKNTAAQSALSQAQQQYENDTGKTMPSGACGCQ